MDRLTDFLEEVKDKISEGEYLKICTIVQKGYNEVNKPQQQQQQQPLSPIQQEEINEAHITKIQELLPTLHEYIENPEEIIQYINTPITSEYLDGFHMNRDRYIEFTYNAIKSIDMCIKGVTVPNQELYKFIPLNKYHRATGHVGIIPTHKLIKEVLKYKQAMENAIRFVEYNKKGFRKYINTSCE